MSQLSEYVKKATNRTSDLSEVMERRKNAKAQELENLEFEALILEQKKKIRDASPETVTSGQTTNFAASILAGRSPEQVKQILSSLTQEEIDKLAYMSARMDPNNFNNLRGAIQAPNTSTKEIVEIIKLINELQQPKKSESNGISGKDLIDAFKTGMEITKVQQPTNSQPDMQYKLVENTLAELKATREDVARQERLRTEKEIAELKNRPSGLDELFYNEEKAAKARKIFGGADTGATNEFSLKKEEMAQTERLETKKLDWEQKKWEMEKDKEGDTLETVKEILAGPAGELLKGLGGAASDRIRGNKTPSSNGQTQQSQFAKVKCPNCSGDFPANIQLPMIQCPLCGVQLQNGNQPSHEQAEHSNQPAPSAPSQELPKDQPPSDSTQTQSSPTPAQEKPVDQTVEVEANAEPTK